MPPNINQQNRDQDEEILSRIEQVKDQLLASDEKLEKVDVPTVIVWRNVGYMAYLHIGAIYGLYLCAVSASWKTSALAFILYIFGGIGITAGAHRLWAHRTYKATFPLRVILGILNTLAFQNDIYEWARDHRVHHKYSETDADPHNATRGFFFSHVGWLLCKKHPHVSKICYVKYT